MKKSNLVNKKFASVALSSAMVLSNTTYSPVVINASESDEEIQIEKDNLTSSSGIQISDDLQVIPEPIAPIITTPVETTPIVTPPVEVAPVITTPTVTAPVVTPQISNQLVRTTSSAAIVYEPTVYGSVTSDPAYSWDFSQSNASAQFTDTSSIGYLAFPQVSGDWTIELEATVTRVGSSTSNGIFVGALSGADGELPQYYAGVGARGGSSVVGLYHKADGTFGSSTIAATTVFAVGTKIPIKVSKTSNGINIVTKGTDGVEVTKSLGYTYLYPNGIQNANPTRAGIIFSNIDCTVENLKYTDSQGVVQYNQATKYVSNGTAPVVASVSATATSGDITATWTDETAGEGSAYYYAAELYDSNRTLIDSEIVLAVAEKKATFKVSNSGTYTVEVYGVLDSTKTSAKACDVAVEIVAVEYAPKVYDPSGKLVANDQSRLMTFAHNSTTSSFLTPSTNAYFMFPETDKYYTMSLDLVMNTVGPDNYRGAFVGLFGGGDGNIPTAVAGVGFRSANNIRGLYTKASEFMGAGGLNFSFKAGEKIPVTVKKTATGVSIKATGFDSNGNVSTQEYVIGYGNIKGITATSLERLGIEFSGVNASVSNIVVTDANGQVVYSQRDKFEALGTAPVVSSVATPTLNDLKTEVSTSWENSTELQGDGAYKVELSTDGGNTFSVVKSETVEKSITVKTSVVGDYVFRVTGILGDNETTSVLSPSIHVIPALAKPIVTISGSDSVVDLSWNAIENATYYNIYRKSAEESEYQLLVSDKSITTNSFKDTNVVNEIPYYYYVQAMSETNLGLDSKVVFALPTGGHKGAYVYEDEACKIDITSKTSDTVLDGKANIKGTVDRKGVLALNVNGILVDSTTDTSFDFNFELAEGRNDVNLIFTDENGKKTLQTYNFVYLTNYNIVVDPSYTGANGAIDETNKEAFIYKTVQAAVDSVPATNTNRVVIFVKNGKYFEHLKVNSPNITLIGEDRENTVIQFYDPSIGFNDMTNRAAVIINTTATNFVAENICFQNTFDYLTALNGQADAIRVDADNSIFVNAKFLGYQDTLLANQGKQYYYKCRIEGLVDFIYGNTAKAVFYDCDIVFKYVPGKLEGHVTAPKHTPTDTYGYTFYDCRVLAEEGCTGPKYDLGRPWGADAFVVYIDTYMTKVIAEGPGFADWSGGATAEEANYYESNSYGPGFAVNQNREQITRQQAYAMLDPTFLGWDPFVLTYELSNSYVRVESDEVSISSMTPVYQDLAQGGETVQITVIGKNLSDCGITLTNGTYTIMPSYVTDLEARFDVLVPENNSDQYEVYNVYTLIVNDKPTAFTSTFCVAPIRNYEFKFDAIGKATAAETGTITDSNGVITITPINGKLDSSSNDIFPFYNVEVKDSDSFSFEVDMTIKGVNTTGTVSNQTFAGIMYRDYISTVANDRPTIAGTGVRGVDATKVNIENFARIGKNIASYPTEYIYGSEAIASATTHKLRFDKYGNTVRMSVDGNETIDQNIINSINLDGDGTSNIGLFAVRNLITEFKNVSLTQYRSGAFNVTPPTKKVYVQKFESTFDTTGLSATLDGEAIPLKECIITGFDVTTTGTKTVTVAYGANSATFDIEVVEPKITNLSIVYTPVKDTYYKGQVLDLTGLKINGIYNGNENYASSFAYGDANFSTLFDVSELDTTLTEGTKTVTISSKVDSNVKATFNVEVLLYELSGLDIIAPKQVEYYVGDGTNGSIDLNTKGMTVNAVYSKGSHNLFERVELNDTNLTIGKVVTSVESQDQKVEVTYKGVTNYVNVNVVSVAPVSAKITAYPKTTYVLGEAYDSTGIAVTVTNNNGTTSTLAYGTDYMIDASSINTSEAGVYVANVIVRDGIKLNSNIIPFNVSYREAFVPNWQTTIFGQSTSLSGTDCSVNITGDVLNGGQVRVTSLNGKGKVTGAQDGISYYYFELDPSKDNFKISADILVNAYSKDTSGATQSHDGQESFGIMARDANNTMGDASSFASNIAAVGGYAGATTAPNGIQGFVRSGVDPSDSSATIAMEVARLTTERAYTMVGKTYKLSLEKDNTGFLMSVNGGTPVRIYSDLDLLAQQNGSKMYVGFYAARVADITVSNVKVSVTDMESDAPQQLKPEQAITPSVVINSLAKYGDTDYNFKFTPNVDGTVKVKQGINELANNLAVTKGVEVVIPTTLASGENNFTVEFWPDSTKNITSSSKVISQYTVNRRLLGTGTKVYVSNTGVESNSGTIDSPVNMQTALDYAVKGQTIYVEGGTYNISGALTAPKDVNGALGQEIVVRPLDESSDVIFDFNNVGSGLRISGDYWHFFKVNVTRSAANSNAIVISGNHNTLESSNAYRNGNTGIQISALAGNAPRSIWPTYNTVINCSSYENRDPAANNADGFTAKITNGVGNKFIGCISYANADDGWDLYSKTESGPIEPVTLINCVAYGNGYINGVLTGGDMNGFKLGGEGQPVNHTIINSLAFDNGANGFDSNSNPNVIARNNVSYNNVKANFNMLTYTNNIPKFVSENFISYYTPDYTSKTKDSYDTRQEQISDVFNETTYYYNGSNSLNSKGEEFTEADFLALQVPTTITRSQDVFGATEANIVFGDLWKNFDEFFKDDNGGTEETVATVTSITPSGTEQVESTGGNRTITVNGTGLTGSNIRLMYGNTEIAPTTITDTKAIFIVALPENVTTLAQTHTYTACLDGKATNYSIKYVVADKVDTTPEVDATVSSITPSGVQNLQSSGGRVTVTVVGTGLTNNNIRLVNGVSELLPITITDTKATFEVVLPENTSSEQKSYEYFVKLDNKVTTLNTSFIVAGKVDTTPEVDATVSSITPSGVQNLQSSGGKVSITVTGTGLTDNNIRLVNGSGEILPVTISDTKATFVVILPENKTINEISYTCFVKLDNKLTALSVSFVVAGKVIDTIVEDDDSDDSSSVGSDSTNEEPTVIETVKDGVSQVVISTVDDVAIKDVAAPIDANSARVLNLETVIAHTKVDERAVEKIIEYSVVNKSLLEKTAMTITTTVKVENVITKEVKEEVVTKAKDDVFFSYDLKDIDLTEKEIKDLVAVRINPDGTTSYLGGKYNAFTGEFVAASKGLEGTFAVIVADRSLYNQVELKVGSTVVYKNRESETLDTVPVIINDTTFVPVRFISEGMGGNVSYESMTKTAVIEIDGKEVRFTVGSKGDATAPFIENGRMLIPLRNISESFGANVIWDSKDKSIQITK